MKTRLTIAALVLLPVIALADSPAVDTATPAGGFSGSGLSAAEIEAASQLGQTISTSEWLGPLAPIALSPFFGMACLAALAQFGPENLVASNGFLSADSPLQNPAIFWTFGVLAVVTSVPRFLKVSKPIAGALEQLESYSSIISLIAIRYLVTQNGEAGTADEAVVYAAGIGSVSIDVLLSVAAAINIVVVNGVKFFFEFLIWLVPFPTLDAIFETCNKAAVAGLMAIYSFSPIAATILNLMIFAVCAVLFVWTHRQVIFMRTMLIGWVVGWIRTGSPPKTPDLVVFPREPLGPFPARDRLTLSRTPDGFVLRKRKLWGGLVEHPIELASTGRIEPGWIAHTLVLADEQDGVILLMSRTHTRHLDVIAALFRVELGEDNPAARPAARDQLGALNAKPS